MPELKEVGGNGQPCLKGLPLMRDAGLTTSTTLFLGTRQGISSESGRDRGSKQAKGKRLRIILGALILASLPSAISKLQAPAWSYLAEPSL